MDKEAMKRLPVESSNIKSIGHNFLTKNLEIEFKDGNIYRYKKVPRSIFRDIMGSESKGKYFFKNIRFDFPYRKYRNKDGEKVKSEWNRLHRKEDVDMSEKAASTILDEMFKEAIALNPVGSMLGSGAAVKSIGKAFSQGKMGRTGWQATKAGLMNVSNQSGKIVAKAGLAAAGGHMLGNAVDNMTKPTEEDQYGRRVAASEKLDEMYKEARLGAMGAFTIGGSLAGAGLGAARGAKNEEKDEYGKTHKIKNAIKGGLLGAASGAAGGAVLGGLTKASLGAANMIGDANNLAAQQAKAVTNPKKEFTLSKAKMTARTEKPNALKRLGQKIHDLFHKPEGLKAKDRFDPVAEQNKKTISGILSGMPKKSCERLMDMVKEASLSPVAQKAIIGGAVGAVGGAATGAGNVMLNEKEKKGKLKKAFSAALKGGAVGGAAGAATGATREALEGSFKKKCKNC